MADLYDLAMQYRQALLAGDAQLAADLTRSYGVAYRSAIAQLRRLTEVIEAARVAGVDFTPAWLYQQERLRNLLATIEEEIALFARQAGRLITDQQARNIEMALGEARSLMGEAVEATTPGLSASFIDPDPRALRQLAGFLSDGTPLQTLLDQLGPATSQAVKEELIRSVALGLNPRQVSRAMGRAMGGNFNRALLIARTETLRAYRETTRLSYEANSDIVTKWVWTAALDSRTCPVCYASHGEEFDTDERHAGHPNCRCVMIPKTKSYRDLGIRGVRDTGRVKIDPGEKAFRRLSEAQQRAILGPSRYDLWKSGRVSLPDMIQTRRNQWGETRTLAPLGALRRQAV